MRPREGGRGRLAVTLHLGSEGINSLKVDSAKKRMLDINPEIKVTTFKVPFTSENAFEIAEGFDLIIDGTDNFPTRYLTNDVSVMMFR